MTSHDISIAMPEARVLCYALRPGREGELPYIGVALAELDDDIILLDIAGTGTGTFDCWRGLRASECDDIHDLLDEFGRRARGMASAAYWTGRY